MALYWATIGNVLVMSALAGGALLLYRFAPTVARRHPLLVGIGAVISGVTLAGNQWPVFAGPSPGWPYRLIVGAAMVVVLTDGTELKGWIEWYDKNCLKLNRVDAPNLLLFKHSIKFMFKEEELRSRRRRRPPASR